MCLLFTDVDCDKRTGAACGEFVVALYLKLRRVIVYLTCTECQQNSTNISPQHENKSCNDFFVAFIITFVILIIVLLFGGLIALGFCYFRKCKFEIMV